MVSLVIVRGLRTAASASPELLHRGCPRCHVLRRRRRPGVRRLSSRARALRSGVFPVVNGAPRAKTTQHHR
jgi:hypothetical protein